MVGRKRQVLYRDSRRVRILDDAPMVGYFRKFGGKRFRYKRTYETLREAYLYCKRQKDPNINCRILDTKSKGGYHYRVYVRGR